MNPLVVYCQASKVRRVWTLSPFPDSQTLNQHRERVDYAILQSEQRLLLFENSNSTRLFQQSQVTSRTLPIQPKMRKLSCAILPPAQA